MKAKLLLLEDDILLGETLQDMLEEEGYVVMMCRNGQEALDATFDTAFDLYLLDINVPLINGIELLRELRGADDATPAIFLTSHRDKEMLRSGFESGGDDYVTKPFDNDELLWRIDALLRRFKGTKKCAGALCHDEAHHCFMLEGRELELSKKEYELLALLMRHTPQIVTKEMIVETLWERDEDPSEGAVRVYINRLKQELGSEAIENIRGVGYRLVS